MDIPLKAIKKLKTNSLYLKSIEAVDIILHPLDISIDDFNIVEIKFDIFVGRKRILLIKIEKVWKKFICSSIDIITEKNIIYPPIKPQVYREPAMEEVNMSPFLNELPEEDLT